MDRKAAGWFVVVIVAVAAIAAALALMHFVAAGDAR
jgi:hypothetical protein